MLIGHPDHDILFIATQVARAAGLKNPSQSSNLGAKLAGHTQCLQFGSLILQETPEGKPRSVQKTSWMFSEGATYQMLLRGHAPASEPFRKWVTEEVLPSIRKTGSYNVNESTTETGQQFAGELASLSDAVAGLLKQNATILGMLRRRQRGGCWSIFRSNTRAPT